jgi:hypothetical protein
MMAKSQEHDFVEAKQKALESVVLPILRTYLVEPKEAFQVAFPGHQKDKLYLERGDLAIMLLGDLLPLECQATSNDLQEPVQI